MRPPSHSFVQQLNNERPPPPGALQLVAAMRPGFTLSTGLGAHEQGSTVSVASRRAEIAISDQTQEAKRLPLAERPCSKARPRTSEI